jgi:hypothetical protein
MSLPELGNETRQPKSFWERPEGTTGMAFIALLGVGGFFLAKAVLPTILAVFGMAITAVGQAITITILCAVLAALLYILTNSKFQTLCSYLFKSSMHKLTGVFIENDPIGIMKSYISDLRKKKVELEERENALNGQIRSCQAMIEKNTQEADKAMSMARVAKNSANNPQFALHSRNAGRLSEFNDKLSVTLTKMQMLYRALKKYSEASDVVIADMTAEVKIREQERKMVLASNSAMRSAMAILKGNDDARELYDQAMEFVVEDYGRKLGEIEDFMNSSQSILDGIDMQNGVWEEKALKQLEAWEAKTDSVLLGDTKRVLIEDMSIQDPVAGLNSTNTIGTDFNRFLR